MEDKKSSLTQIRQPFFIALALACGVFIGAQMFGGASPIEKVVRNYNKFREVLMLINKDYVDTVNADELTDIGINQMLEHLDPHSVYIPTKEVELAKAPLEGDFDGIGIEFLILKDTIQVVTPLSGGPSETVGLRAGDRIVNIDGKKVAGVGITNRDVFGKLRGKRGTKVIVEVSRKNERKLLPFTIIRNKIPTQSVETGYMIDSRTGYLKVSRFAANTYDEFALQLQKLKDKGMNRLVLDLRDNPGGYMDRAVRMADDFLVNNRLIVYTDGKLDQFDQKIYSSPEGSFEQGAVIVLVNEGSASASEIVAGALQDNDRALIVGRRSFGKGLVQMPYPLTDGSELRLTISRYYTPSGRSIQKSYAKGEQVYESDMENRYKKGEFFSADSIKFADSLRFKTRAGRLVYGGGGIMPDVFVPIDTAGSSAYLVGLYNKNVLREYTLDYARDNRKSLEKMGLPAFLSGFDINKKMQTALQNLAAKNGLPYKEAQFRRSEKMILTAVKAFIARSVWGDEGFYPVINQQDELFLQALGQFDKAEKLTSK